MKIKKILTIIALSTMGLSVAILIGAIFGLDAFSGIFLKLLLSFGTIAVATAFSISVINFLKTNKIVGWISLSLLGATTLCALITYWSDFNMPALFNKLLILISVATILFIIIVNTNVKLEKRYQVLQTITYALIVVLDIIISLLIFGVQLFEINFFLEIFCVLCLVVFAMLCTLAILGKDKKGENSQKVQQEKDNEYIKLTKEEHQQLLNKIKLLEEENKNLKALNK